MTPDTYNKDLGNALPLQWLTHLIALTASTPVYTGHDRLCLHAKQLSLAAHANYLAPLQLQDASGVAAVWAPEVVRDQLQAFRSSDDLLSFFTELKELLHVSDRAGAIEHSTCIPVTTTVATTLAIQEAPHTHLVGEKCYH